MRVGYWYISFEDAPTQFFYNEQPLTEELWRARAPANQIEKLDAEQRQAKGGLFPNDVTADDKSVI
jgi:hypothetical protein